MRAHVRALDSSCFRCGVFTLLACICMTDKDPLAHLSRACNRQAVTLVSGLGSSHDCCMLADFAGSLIISTASLFLYFTVSWSGKIRISKRRLLRTFRLSFIGWKSKLMPRDHTLWAKTFPWLTLLYYHGSSDCLFWSITEALGYLTTATNWQHGMRKLASDSQW